MPAPPLPREPSPVEPPPLPLPQWEHRVDGQGVVYVSNRFLEHLP